jgi:hypothetical protein
VIPDREISWTPLKVAGITVALVSVKVDDGYEVDTTRRLEVSLGY